MTFYRVSDFFIILLYMSEKNIEEIAPEKDSEPTFAGLARKASESTVEMMEYFKGHLQEEGQPE